MVDLQYFTVYIVLIGNIFDGYFCILLDFFLSRELITFPRQINIGPFKANNSHFHEQATNDFNNKNMFNNC